MLTLLGGPEERRDPGLSAAAREAVLAALTDTGTASAEPGAANAAAALRASLDETAALSKGERALLEEWLDRIANERPGSPEPSCPAGPGGIHERR